MFGYLPEVGKKYFMEDVLETNQRKRTFFMTNIDDVYLCESNLIK